MKYIGILLSIVLISSCIVMKKNHYERQNECKVKFYGQYWGDCYIEISESDPAFSFQISTSVGIDRWNLLKLESKDIKEAVDNNSITVIEANNRFVSILEELKNISDSKKEKTGQKLEAFADSLKEMNDAQSGTNGTNSSFGMMYSLSNSYMSGGNRICIYRLGSNVATHTIRGIGMCPLSMNF
jgi:hypothetical protein